MTRPDPTPWRVLRQHSHLPDVEVCRHRWEWRAYLCAWSKTRSHPHECGGYYSVRRELTRAERMAELTERVLARFREELVEADALQLQHLAQRAEARYSSPLGERMRALVTDELDRRVRRAVELSPLTNRYRSWMQ